MRAFEYSRPTDLAEALALLNSDPEAKLLAGGQTLLPSLRLRLAAPTRLVDLQSVPGLKAITGDDSHIEIGAMARHVEVAKSSVVAELVPALADLAAHIGDRMVRNMGTLGGSIANNDPAADYTAAVLALNGTITTNERSIAADDFFVGMFETALKPNEILLSVRFPVPRRAAYIKLRHPASRFALTGVFVAQTSSGTRMAVTGAGASAFRVPDMEAALNKDFTVKALEGIAVDPQGLSSDMHASAEYRANLIHVAAERSVAKALART